MIDCKTMNKIKELRNKMREIQQQLVTESTNVFNEEMLKIFEQFPEIKTIGWNQYTPYFNDGSECIFSAHIDDFEVNGQSKYYYREETWDKKPNVNYNPKVLVACEKIRELLNQFDDDFYKFLFGDHVRIILTKGRAATEDYNHD